MLNDDVVEERFGLKTAVNLIGFDKIRSIKKTNIGTTNKISREQMSKESTINDFGFDIDLDLINGITGKVLIKDFIEGNISGSNSLRLTANVDITNMDEFLLKIYRYYLKEDYKEDFGWIDQIMPVKSKTLLEKLDKKLFKLVSKGDHNFYMAIPEIIDFKHYKGIKMQGINEIQDDIELDTVIRSFRKGLNSIEQFKNRIINVISTVNDDVMERFNSYKCFVGELEYNNKTYAISRGNWFEIENNYVKDTNNKFNQIKTTDLVFPEIYKGEHEIDYNKRFADSNKNDFLLLDKKLIIHGGNYSKIEICDILTKNNELIHVKRYSGSGGMSHLFNQGLVSGELIRVDMEFINKANKQIKNDKFKLDPNAEYKIIYAIAEKEGAKLKDLPFFSKVTLNKINRTLTGLRYNVNLKYIRYKESV